MSPGGVNRRQILGAAATPLAASLAAAPLAASFAENRSGVPGLRLSFQERFAEPVSFYDPVTRAGRWKTNYWFGDQSDQSSRSLPDERQIYVDRSYCGISPFVPAKGGLRILADKNRRPDDARLFSPYTGRVKPFAYTSGLLTTETSFRQRYGYFEATMAFPQVRGCWPAFWLLGPPHTDHAGDELDVVEWVASNPRRLFLSAHIGGKGQSTWVDGFETRAPVAYGLLWTRDKLKWFVNGKQVHERPNPGIHQPMYMLLNLAIGGWDGNLPEDPGGFPAALLITSVEAYALRDGGAG
ncbi:glycoside hydrolase family 16 protein [Phenylobacterium sp.]|jgi:hypothetical protein|uniref:glycoside hydrolase family 16 protein n=1 Tax=Phenylobacterium sp. TaxID=1871053 RepID=UPI002F3FDE94